MLSGKMIAIEQLIQVTAKKYFFLKMLSGKNELLKYFIVGKDGLFTPSSISEIEDEFFERFRGNFLSPREAVKSKEKIPYQEYQRGLFLSCLMNYISTLEKAIDFAEKLN